MRSSELFYAVMIITFLYSIYKFRSSIFYIFIILIFYDGMFAYGGTGLWNLYKIFLPVIALYCTLKYRSFAGISSDDRPVVITFVLFTASFLLSSFISGDYFKLIFSQYAKYVNLFLFFFIFKRISSNINYFERTKHLLFWLLLIQIVLTVVKYYVWGIRESVVGSISYTGGGAATVLPILGFVFIWLTKKGNLDKKDWLFVALLMFIGFVSMKRAIWFIMPLVVFMFYTYVQQKKLSKKLIFAIPVIPLIFYLGVKYNPTLNPEYKIGGTFDLGYAANYAKEYTFGKDGNKLGTGRGGATLLLFSKLVSFEYSKTDLVGNGLKPIYAADEETYNDPGFGLNQRGSASGVYQTYISAGFIGIFATLAFALSLLFQIRDKRFRNGLIIIFFWEYFFYSGLILRTQALSFLIVYFIIYANMQCESSKYVIISKANNFTDTAMKGVKII